VAGLKSVRGSRADALYVRVDHIGRGIGSRLLEVAKAHSSGSLWLFTFAKNTNARRFYAKHGFIEVAYGFEPFWKLDDVKLTWSASNGAANSSVEAGSNGEAPCPPRGLAHHPPASPPTSGGASNARGYFKSS
jgi:hypothetical protein